MLIPWDIGEKLLVLQQCLGSRSESPRAPVFLLNIPCQSTKACASRRRNKRGFAVSHGCRREAGPPIRTAQL